MDKIHMKKDRVSVLRIVATYAVFGFLWIYLSDTLLGWIIHDPHRMMVLGTYKGAMFIALTSHLLYFLISRYIKRIDENTLQLKISEDRFQSIYHGISDAVFIHDAETGAILNVNRTACEMFRCTFEELTASNVEEFSLGEPPYAQADALKWLTLARQGEPQQFEWRSKRKDGSLFWSEINMRADKVGDESCIIVLVRDITERKHSESEKQRMYLRQSAILDNLPMMAWLKDKDSRIEMVNSIYAESCGLTVSECIGKTDLDIYPREIAERFIEGDREVCDSRLKKQIEEKIETPEGVRWEYTCKTPLFDENNAVVGTAGVAVDITEIKRLELENKAQKERAEQYLNIAQVILVALDDQARITLINQKGYDVLEYQDGELIGKNWFHVCLPPEEYVSVMSVYQQLMAGQHELYKYYENAVLTKSGKKRLIAWKNALLKDENGHINGLLSSGEDITDRRRAEEDRINLERSLLHAQKLESLGVLAGGIAHDFNNLLAAILGNLDLARLRLPIGSPVHENIEQSMQATRRASDLTCQMLAYAGKGMFQLKAVDLNEMVMGNTGLFRTVIPRNITFNVTADGELPKIMADPGQIQQVVMNLITNAAEAIDSGTGVICLSTGVMQCEEAYIQQSVLAEKPPEGQFVYVEVSDNGAGMNKETQLRLFDPFFTTKFTGRGLGMAATQGIVSSHKGMIMLESEEGKGTVFRILLPVCENSEADISRIDGESEADSETNRIRTGKILIVDDEAVIRNVIADYAEYFGFEHMMACDGNEALTLFKQHVDDIALVILDLTMPVMDGITTFQELKKIKPDVRVILSSGYSEQSAAEQFMSEKPDAFIQKPFQAKDFKQKIDQILK